MFDVLCAGFVCADSVLKPVDELPPPGGNRFVQQAGLAIGGCAANAAVVLAPLLAGEGGRSAVAGRVGDDPLGQLLRSQLAGLGVDTRYLLVTAEAATALNTVLVNRAAERSFFVFPGACDLVTPADLPTATLQQFAHLHLAAMGAMAGLAGQAGAALAARAQRLGLSVSLDVTLNPPRDSAADVGPLLPHVDLFLPNLAEARALLGDGDVESLLDRGLAHGVRLMGLKLGEAGCFLATPERRVRAPAIAVQAVDTSGAGDAWAAAVIYAWRKGWPLETIGRFANAAGAACVQQIGASAGLGDAGAIWRFAAQSDVARLPDQAKKAMEQNSLSAGCHAKRERVCP